MIKKRLDLLIQEKWPNLSRNKIKDLIKNGLVELNNKNLINLTKPSTLVDINLIDDLSLISSKPKYVSKAGFKLAEILKKINIDLSDLVALDAGISTGGFTDCLLQNNIEKVYGIDVGVGQTDLEIVNNPKVVLLEKTNIRNLDNLPEQVDLVTLDLSFISVLKVIDNVKKFFKLNSQAKLIILIKPQFELEVLNKIKYKKNILKDVNTRKKIADKVIFNIEQMGFKFISICDSPNSEEYLAYFNYLN